MTDRPVFQRLGNICDAKGLLLEPHLRRGNKAADRHLGHIAIRRRKGPVLYVADVTQGDVDQAAGELLRKVAP